jgi:hypothetical protein
MAKRIKVSGKPPRGLSKAERVVKGADATFKGQSRLVNNRRERENYKGELVGIPDRLADSNIETLAGLRDYAHLSDKAKRGQTKPSSTRKKLVKEGNPNFIGPRSRKSIISEAFEGSSRQTKKIRMEEDDSSPISNNDEIYRRIGRMILRRFGSRQV